MRRYLLISGFCSLICIASVRAEESYKQLSHEYNLDYQNWLRGKILKFPKKATVELELKNHNIVRGVFEGYSKYDDSFWILPLEKHGLFADEAYDISEILDVKIIVLRSI